MKKYTIMGNWKMNGHQNSLKILLTELLKHMPNLENVNCAVFPPSIYLPLVSELLRESAISWGAQNVYPQDSGAFTGEISAPMLKDFECRYVLVGHSERRHIFHESEKYVAEKFHHVKDHDMIPVLCLGETLEQREQGLTYDVLSHQLRAIIQTGKNVFDNCIIAYEPVWAIGTGKTATAQEAQAAHAFIRSQVTEFRTDAALNLPILYGGSVNEKNARSLFTMPDVNGGLIGGASLNAQQFVEIVKCIN